jgi:hypothetical protein
MADFQSKELPLPKEASFRAVQGVPGAEGPYCGLLDGARRPPPDVLSLVIPASTVAAREQARRDFDAAQWRDYAEALDRAAESGNIGRTVAAELAAAIRCGLGGILPLSWVPPEVSSYVSTAGADYLGDARARAVIYRFAADRGYVEDKHPAQTIQERCGINERTWWRWSTWSNDKRARTEAALELLLLERPDLLGDPTGEAIRHVLLIKDTPDTEAAEVSGPDG